MNFLEKLTGRGKEQPEPTSINPEHISQRGEWSNGHQRIRISIDENDSMKYSLRPDGEEDILTDSAAIQTILEQGGFVFTPALNTPAEENEQNGTVPTESEKPRAVVIPINETAAQVLEEQAQQTVWESTDTELEIEIASVRDSVNAALRKVTELLQATDAIEEEEKDAIRGQMTEIFDWIETIDASNDFAKKAAEKQGLSEAYLEKKREIVQQMKEQLHEAEQLGIEVETALADTGTADAKVEADAPVGGNLDTLLGQTEDVAPPKELTPPAQTEARESATQGNERQALEMFLERPEGKVILNAYRGIITRAWQRFHDSLTETGKDLSWNKKLEFWKEHFLQDIMQKLERDLVEQHGVEPDQDYAILSTLMEDLHQEFMERQEKRDREKAPK